MQRPGEGQPYFTNMAKGKSEFSKPGPKRMCVLHLAEVPWDIRPTESAEVGKQGNSQVLGLAGKG